MEHEKTYEKLQMWASRQEDQGAWVFGVTIDGVDVELLGRKLGGIDSALEAARIAAAEKPPAKAK